MSKAYPTPELTVFYDGSCPLCRREISVYSRRDTSTRIRWADVSACSPEILPKGLTRQDALARFHVQRADGSVIAGAGAFAELWAHTPGFPSFPAIEEIMIIRWMEEQK